MDGPFDGCFLLPFLKNLDHFVRCILPWPAHFVSLPLTSISFRAVWLLTPGTNFLINTPLQRGVGRPTGARLSSGAATYAWPVGSENRSAAQHSSFAAPEDRRAPVAVSGCTPTLPYAHQFDNPSPFVVDGVRRRL